MQVLLANTNTNVLANSQDVIKDLSDTLTLRVALSRPKKDCWVNAICSELNNIKSEDMYDLVDPSNQKIDNILGNKIVLQQKCGPTRKVEQYKACFMA